MKAFWWRLARRFVCKSGAGAILLQLIVQRFQAESLNFRSPGLVIVCGRESLENQRFFGGSHRCTHLKPYAFTVRGSLQSAAAEVRWQVPLVNKFPVAHNHSAFQGIPDFPNVAGP